MVVIHILELLNRLMYHYPLLSEVNKLT